MLISSAALLKRKKMTFLQVDLRFLLTNQILVDAHIKLPKSTSPKE
jgi:hypothetical protein